MIRYILRRLVLLIPVILIVSFMVFVLMDLAPGDISAQWDLSGMTEEEIQELRDYHGLDDPVIVRYGRYMFRLIQGDLGVGDFHGIPVWTTFIDRLPNTLALAGVTIAIGVIVGLPLGIFAAKRAGRAADSATTAFSMLGLSMPGFWLGILLMLVFAYILNWLPAGGFNHGFLSLILPGVTAAMMLLAACMRQTRSSMLEVLNADYLRTARAKGVPEKVVIRKHALGNALIPIVTTIGMTIAMAVAGTAVIEQVFAFPGIGRLVVDAVGGRDVTTSTGVVIMTTAMYVIILLLVDVAYAFIDPRIRAQYVARNAKKIRVRTSAKVAASELQDAAPVAEAVAAPAAPAEVATAQVGARFTKSEAPEEVQIAAPEAEDDEPEFVSFATVTDTDIDTTKEESSAADSGELASQRFKKRSRGAEIMRHLLKNPGAVAGMIIILLIVGCFVASLFMSFDSVTAANPQYRFSPPSWRFPFGTDRLGRCSFSRVIYATRFSLPIGVGATSLATLVGVLLGSFAAFKEGTVIEEVIMRFCDALASIPGILLGMVIITTLGRSLPNLIIAISIGAILIFIRISRAAILQVRGNEYVEAAKALGLSNLRILYQQMLPNGMAPIIIVFTASLGSAILISAGLSFLGFGVPVPNPEWGSLVSDGRDQIRNAPWLTTFPGLFIMTTVMGFNLLGDGLRDAFDPKLKR